MAQVVRGMGRAMDTMNLEQVTIATLGTGGGGY